MCILLFVAWIFLLWEVITKTKGKDGGWIVLCAYGASICAFLCGVVLVKILYF
jgi:hypothetical protein